MSKEVYCLYRRAWVPMGRSRTRCPACGASLGVAAHATRPAEPLKGTQ